MEEVYSAQTSEVALEAIINNAVQIPGVKVDRQKFLGECFAKEDVDTQQIIDLGPIGAGCTREDLARIANKLILVRTSTSSAASFAMGIPGGLAMGLTVPADTLQFFWACRCGWRRNWRIYMVRRTCGKMGRSMMRSCVDN